MYKNRGQNFTCKAWKEEDAGKTRAQKRYNIKMNLREIDWRVWIGLLCFRLGTGGGLL
jgi:hypothetical protein